MDCSQEKTKKQQQQLFLNLAVPSLKKRKGNMLLEWLGEAGRDGERHDASPCKLYAWCTSIVMIEVHPL